MAKEMYASGMSTKTTQLDWREGRRRRAWELKQQRWKQQDIAAALGVTPGAVSQWLKRGRDQGVEGLRRHPAPGRQSRLTPEQLAQIPALLEAGAEASGFRGQIWTYQRVAEVIRRRYGVRYHPAHVSRLVHAVRHSVQRPRARATQRDETAIQAWWQERWPALEKSGRGRADHRLGRPIRFLFAALGGAHLGAVRADARAHRAAHP
jgi:transposase